QVSAVQRTVGVPPPLPVVVTEQRTKALGRLLCPGAAPVLCTTPGRNRNQCGSLLLFPELDNTEGVKTLFTITDACAPDLAAALQVEIVYINRTNCLENNARITLTPGDQFTFVTKSLLSNDMTGFAYAFARQTSAVPIHGTPIVANRLIGEETILNGISSFEYTLNAVSFRGIGEEGAPNDDDGDGIRDLNGPGALGEYEEAPDQLAIPRFLGQDPDGGVVDSDLILMSLSGGSAFNTVVLFLVYNERGILITSQEAEFRCWEKRQLRDWAPGTLNAGLDNLMDPNDSDPGEPVGLEPRQAGWIWLNGQNATSASEDIVDPAIYAVLIERSNGGQAASLPFELCSQTNGDLVLLSSAGDTPQTGDGQ
ncbi:MAG: hypothetical protein ACSLFQ_20550, partial [Thermoanaerobaculia bacterium]